MNTIDRNLSRRNFIKLGGLSGAALTLGLYMPALGKESETEIITRDFLSEKTSADADISETRNRALREAVQMTINELSDKLLVYLNNLFFFEVKRH